jgi:hypothetical protein
MRKRRRGESAESTRPTELWSEIAVRGTISPGVDDGKKEPGAGQQVGEGEGGTQGTGM